MKRLFTFAILLGLLGLFTTANADSPRKVLFQHFTSASCGPCAQLAPDYYNYLKSNLDKVIPISFHGNYMQDVMEDHYGEAASAYANYYAIQGVPTLVISGNKYKSSPIPGNFSSIVNSLSAESSPFTINIQSSKTGITNDLAISVHSSKKYLNDLYLRVAVVEAYHYYDNAGTNGEKHFYFINRNMLPDPQGTAFKISKDETKSFNLSYNLHPEWHPNMVFVVVWVQDDSNKEIYQAASTPIPDLTNIENKPTFSLQIVTAEPATKVTEMQEYTKIFQVKNTNNFPVKAAFVLVPDMSSIPDDWSVVIDKSEETIPAGGTTEVKATINTGVENALGIFTLGAIPLEDYDLPKSAISSIYMLSEGVKYAIFNSMMSMYGPPIFKMVLDPTNYGDRTALLPFVPEITSVFKPEDFDVAIFSTTTPYGSIAFLYPDMINAIHNMLNNGKNVIVFSDASGLAAQHPQMPQQYSSAINNFFTNTLKIQYAGTLGWVQNSTLYQFRVVGLPTDTVGRDFSANFNGSTVLFTPYTDFFTIPSGSPAEMVCYYNNDENPNDMSKVAGIRLENPNGSKIVYFGFPLEVATSIAPQRILLLNAFRWFVGEQKTPQPEIVTDLTDIDFETVKIGEHKDITIEVYNFGDADLKISKIEVQNDPDGVFTILDPEPRTVEPDGMTSYTIRFAPKEEKVYTLSELVIFNNDRNYKTYTVGLKGSGVLPEATGPRVKLSATSADFGIVDTDNYSDISIEISNTGIQDLVITELRIDNNEDNVFEIISNLTNPLPSSIPPAGKYTMTIRFTPISDKIYNALLRFTANTPENPYYEIPLSGIGNIPTSVVDNSNDLFEIKVGPNPFANATNITLAINHNKPVDAQIFLVDISGKKVESIVNGTIATGLHNYKFDGSVLPNGTYYLICDINGKRTALPLIISR